MFNFGKTYKYLEKVCGNGFWQIKNILTYGRAIMLVTGTRGVGKSTQVALLCIYTYVLFKKTCMYIRRRPKALQKTYKEFFNSAVEIYNDWANEFNLPPILSFKAKDGHYWICFKLDENEEPLWEDFGAYGALSEEEDIKSKQSPDTVILIYDEFISKNENGYLGTKDNPEAEWIALNSICVTIDRKKGHACRNELALFCLGNKANIYNPIMLSLGVCDFVDPFNTQRFTAPKGRGWVWEDVDRVEKTAELEESVWVQEAPESAKAYDYSNQDVNTQASFLKRPEKSSKVIYLATLVFKREEYGIYVHTGTGDMFIDNPKPNRYTISMDVGSHGDKDAYLIRNWRQERITMKLTEAYQYGNLYFKNGKVQNVFLRYLEFTK